MQSGREHKLRVWRRGNTHLCHLACELKGILNMLGVIALYSERETRRLASILSVCTWKYGVTFSFLHKLHLLSHAFKTRALFHLKYFGELYSLYGTGPHIKAGLRLV